MCRADAFAQEATNLMWAACVEGALADSFLAHGGYVTRGRLGARILCTGAEDSVLERE